MHIISSHYNSQTFWGMQWQHQCEAKSTNLDLDERWCSSWAQLSELRACISSTQWTPSLQWFEAAELNLNCPQLTIACIQWLEERKGAAFNWASHILFHNTFETRYLSFGFWIELDFLYWLTEIRKAKNVCWLMFSFPFQTLCFVTLCFICKFPLHFFWMGA